MWYWPDTGREACGNLHVHAGLKVMATSRIFPVDVEAGREYNTISYYLIS